MKTKCCTRCGKRKPVTNEFFVQFPQAGHVYFSSRCRPCLCRAAEERRKAEPARYVVWHRHYRLRVRGRDPERYDQLLVAQKGRCANGHRVRPYAIMQEQAGWLVCAACMALSRTA